MLGFFLSSFLGFRIYIYFGVVAGGRCADNFDGDGVVFFFAFYFYLLAAKA